MKTETSWTPQRIGDQPCTVQGAVFQALGTASACWDNLRGAGVFQSDEAKAVGDAIVAGLRELGIDPGSPWPA